MRDQAGKQHFLKASSVISACGEASAHLFHFNSDSAVVFPCALWPCVHRLKLLSSCVTKVNPLTQVWLEPGAPDVGGARIFICTHGLSDLHLSDPSDASSHLLPASFETNRPQRHEKSNQKHLPALSAFIVKVYLVCHFLQVMDSSGIKTHLCSDVGIFYPEGRALSQDGGGVWWGGGHPPADML